MGRAKRRYWVLALLMLVWIPGWSAAAAEPAPSAQPDPRNLDATSLGGRVDLSRDWLFASGDHADYSSPTLDDRSWTRVTTSVPLQDYGIAFAPYSWYRLHARLRPGSHDLALGVQGVVGAYEVFANGVRLGGRGDMAVHRLQTQPMLVAYPLPDRLFTGDNAGLIVALRFSNYPMRYPTRDLESPLGQNTLVVLATQDAMGRDASYRASHMSLVNLFQGGLQLVIGLVALALYFALRSQREYLAIAIQLLAGALSAGVEAWRELHTTSLLSFTSSAIIDSVAILGSVEFIRLVLRLPRSRMWLLLEFIAVVGPLSDPFALSGTSPVILIFVLFFMTLFINDVVLPYLLLRGCWLGNRDARVLLPAILLGIVADYYNFALQAMYYLHLRTTPTQKAIYVGSYRWTVEEIGSFAFEVTILLFLVLRTLRIARERAEAAGEIEAAQTMQRLLLARASQPTPGFAVESVYHPASEVGGDFFLVSPGLDGSLTAIVGDVSGKGLLAAMRVSMILGVLRREDAREPAVILARLNEALLSQGDLGFTTACCVRLEHTGAFAVANAGHIAPYLAGREVETEPALPLGMAGEQQYAIARGQMLRGERLVLMSDGVVEARAASGELYGFERLPGLTLMPAQDIADIAQRFGQEDDITVLTISCGA